MQWFGKALGGIIGLAAAGPIGSVIGILLGHQMDQSGLRLRRAELGGAPQQVSPLFLEVAFEVMGRIAKADGRVSESEIHVARGIMQGLRLSAEQIRIAIDCFTRGKLASYPLEHRLQALADEIGERRELARAFVQIQLEAALGAEPIAPTKRQLLWRVASGVGVGRTELAEIESLIRAHIDRGAKARAAAVLDDAYRVLGIASDASDDDVKTAYRRLMNRHHPDKLVARGQPESMVAAAERKTHEIRSAYEKIKAQRRLR
jgi:DnaJ like chaperone protein